MPKDPSKSCSLVSLVIHYNLAVTCSIRLTSIMCLDAVVEVKELLGTGEEAKEARSTAMLDQLADDADSFSRARRLAKKLPPHMVDTLDREGTY